MIPANLSQQFRPFFFWPLRGQEWSLVLLAPCPDFCRDKDSYGASWGHGGSYGTRDGEEGWGPEEEWWARGVRNGGGQECCESRPRLATDPYTTCCVSRWLVNHAYHRLQPEL